jgi:hypothetical protein
MLRQAKFGAMRERLHVPPALPNEAFEPNEEQLGCPCPKWGQV